MQNDRREWMGGDDYKANWRVERIRVSYDIIILCFDSESHVSLSFIILSYTLAPTQEGIGIKNEFRDFNREIEIYA